MKDIKISIIAVLISFLAITAGFSVILKTSHDEALNKDLKISALINEVGDLKQSNDEIYATYKKEASYLKNIYGQIAELNQHVIDNKQADIRIEKVKTEMAAAIKEKESTISELAKKNILLKQEITASDYSPEIEDILVIGQNKGLTDAMIIVSINPGTKNITTVSIPRDLYHKGRKINELFNLYGIEKLEEALYDVTGIYPDKYVIIDFTAFVGVIDSFDGVEVNIEKDLVDNQYPGPDFTYRKITFKKGLHHMDGQTALKYARSRKSTTDFDRSFRQQQVLLALYKKVRGMDLLQNMDKVISVYESIKDNIKTDLSIFEIMAFYDRYKDFEIKSGNVISNQNFLYNSVSGTGQYILLPVNGSYAAIKSYISDLIKA